MICAKKLMAIFIIIITLTMPLFNNLINLNGTNMNPTLINRMVANDSETDNNLSFNQIPVQTKPILQKIFPLVLKNFVRVELYTEINFTVQNTLNIPLHNFSLTYYHFKDTTEEYPGRTAIYPESMGFIIKVEEINNTRIVFYFELSPLSEIGVNETVILSLQFYANSSQSNLSGDGVEWNCSEVWDGGVIYDVADPSQDNYLIEVLLNS